MYPLSPIKVYMLDRVRERPEWVARMERIAGALDPPPREIVRITPENLPEVACELQRLWPPEA